MAIPKRILVVDDETDVRDFLKIALEDAGFSVETAVDGLDALGKVRQNPPDLISLDLVMPRHSGARFYRELQKDRKLAAIPVLIVTGHARDEAGRADFEEMTMSGRGVYLEKPVGAASYVAAVCRLVGVEPEIQQPAGELRDELSRALSKAGPEELRRALSALKERK